MTAASFIDFIGLSEHPDRDSLADDLHEEFYDTAMGFIADLRETDPLTRALLHPNCRRWAHEHLPLRQVQRGMGASGPTGDRYGPTGHTTGVVVHVNKHWVTVETVSGDQRSRRSIAGDETCTVQVPLPVDLSWFANRRTDPAAQPA